MATFRKVGTFTQLVDPRSRAVVDKEGGNVATYVCTPDGRVLDAIAGNVPAEVLLDELTWSLALWARARAAPTDDIRRAIVAAAHRERAFPIVAQRDGPFPEGEARAVVMRGGDVVITNLPAVVMDAITGRPTVVTDGDVACVEEPVVTLVIPGPTRHAVLAERPLAPLEEVFPQVWSTLGEVVSDAPVQVRSGYICTR